MARIALVTARRARGQVEEAARHIAEATGWEVKVFEAPVEIAALIPKNLLEDIIRSLKDYDLVIVPGGLGYPVEELGRRHGVAVVRGPRDAAGLMLLAELGEEGLQRLREAGELSPSLLLDRWLTELREHHARSPGLDLCGLRVPLRPPPLVVAAEVYGREGGLEGLVAEAERLASHGADMIVLGPPSGWGAEEIVEAARLVRRKTGLPVALDTADVEAAAEAIREGYACLYMSMGLWNREHVLESLPGGAAVVALPLLSDFSLPPSFLERVETLQRLVAKAREAGLRPIADPVLDAPGQGSLGLSIASYYVASRELEGVPLMAGIANFYELMDADSHGQIAALTQILAESGASILLVTEASPKTRMAVAEAKIAATMVSLSLLKRRQPKDLGIDLLYAKEKRPAEPGTGVPRKPRHVLDARTLSAWHGFRLDRAGSHRIRLEGNTIADYYIGRRGTILLRGRDGRSVYRAAAYLGLAEEPSHYAYLGYELCKAEHAAKMARSYRQDEPLLTPPWHRRQTVYDPLRMTTTRLKTGQDEDA